MRTGMAVAATALAALAAVASAAGMTAGGYWQFFVGLTGAAVVVTVCVARPRDGSVEVARAVALAWDGVAAWAAFLLAGFAGTPSSPPPGPPELFLGIPVTAYHVAAMWGGAVLVTIAAFGTSRRSRLRVSWEDR